MSRVWQTFENCKQGLTPTQSPAPTQIPGLREAMDHYEQAHELSPPENDDAILRWNSCVRTIRRGNLQPRQENEQESMLE